MMKSSPSLSYLAVFLLLTIGDANAWSTRTTSKAPVLKTRQDFLQGIATTAVAWTLVPQVGQAADGSVFNHQYSDPKHPNCKRIVVAKLDGTVSVSGTDGTPGCPEDGSGNVWRLPGEVDGKTILVDFSAKGGPANLKGVWDGDGIKWPDGNKWTVKD